MTINWEPLRDIIESNQRFVLSSHVRPDADALGSELGMAAILESMGKSVRIVNPSAIPDSLLFLDPTRRILKIGKGITPEEVADTDVHIVVDTSAWIQLGKVADVLKTTAATKVVIDHHVSSDDMEAIEFKDTEAEAAGALVFRMAETLGFPLSKEIAVPLFAALATDTGWFRFSSTTGDTMRIAGRLIDLGAQPALTYQWLYELCSPTRMKLIGRALTTMELDCEGRLAYTIVTQSDFADTGAKPVETEDIVNECLRIEGTEVAYIAIEQQNKSIKYSFRSRTGLNVAAVAEQFGGGGHKQASGAILPGPLADAQSKVLAALKAALAEK